MSHITTIILESGGGEAATEPDHSPWLRTVNEGYADLPEDRVAAVRYVLGLPQLEFNVWWEKAQKRE